MRKTVTNRTTIETARKVIRGLALQGKGTTCPCCDQTYNGYSYPFHKSLAEAMIKLVRVHERTDNWVHVAFVDPTRHLAKALKWGLVEQRTHDNGTVIPGYWKPTKKGNDFVYKNKTIPSHVQILNNKAIDYASTKTTVVKAIGGQRAYEDLMSAL